MSIVTTTNAELVATPGRWEQWPYILGHGHGSWSSWGHGHYHGSCSWRRRWRQRWRRQRRLFVPVSITNSVLGLMTLSLDGGDAVCQKHHHHGRGASHAPALHGGPRPPRVHQFEAEPSANRLALRRFVNGRFGQQEMYITNS